MSPGWQFLFNIIFALAAIVTILVFFGVTPATLNTGIIMPLSRKWKLALMLGLMVLSLGMSGYGYYRALRPKIIEKIIEKPVERIVERQCPKLECPELTKASNQGLKVKHPQSPAAPPLSQECAPGANCAQSSGQSGGITAGQINVGAQDWDKLLDLPKQNALKNALKQSQGKFRLEWLSQDVGGMKMAGFLNYAFLQAQWTPDQIANYAGSICYPTQTSDCSGLTITVKDRNSKTAKTVITAISAFVPNVHITESDKAPDDRVDLFIAKASW